MPLEGYYTYGGLNREHRLLHREIFRALFKDGIVYSSDIKRNEGLMRVAKRVLGASEVVSRSGSEDERKIHLAGLVWDQFTALSNLGVLEIVNKHSSPVQAYRINPAVASELHRFVRRGK